MSPEEALRERLHSLSAAADLPAPPLEVDDESRHREPRADVVAPRGVGRIVVPPALLDATPAEQDWHLAAALGWWTSPEPRRHRRAAPRVRTRPQWPGSPSAIGTPGPGTGDR